MFNPNPAGWFTPTGSISSDPRGLLPSDPGFRGLPTRSGLISTGDMADGASRAAQYERYLADLEEMYAESAGFEREKLAAQIKDADAARKNAMAIAQLQSETSRYGVDVGRQTALDQLYEQARQFDARHALDEQEFGLKYASTLTDYLSTPDRAFQGRLFERSFAAMNQGRMAPQYRADGDIEQPNTADQFAALASTGVGSTNTTPTRVPVGATGQGAVRQMGTTGASTDGRLKAMSAIAQAIPPSNKAGYTARDFAALRAMGEVYAAPGADEMDRAEQEGIKVLERGPGGFGLGQYQSLAPSAQRGLKSLAQTRGINWEDFDTQRKRLIPNQGAVMRA